MADQSGDILGPFSQGGHLYRKYVQPIEEIGPKDAVRDCALQIPIGCGHHPHVRRDRLRPANPVEFAFLDYPQEGNLRLSGQLADFVQEYRAAFRQFKSALAALHRSRESASLMAEKFGSNQ